MTSTNCLHSYRNEMCLSLANSYYFHTSRSSFWHLIQTRIASSFNLTFRYLENTLSFNNPNLIRFHPREIEVDKTRHTIFSNWCLDLNLHPDILSVVIWNLTNCGFNFEIIYSLISIILISPAYTNSKIIRYQEACSFLLKTLENA